MTVKKGAGNSFSKPQGGSCSQASGFYGSPFSLAEGKVNNKRRLGLLFHELDIK